MIRLFLLGFAFGVGIVLVVALSPHGIGWG